MPTSLRPNRQLLNADSNVSQESLDWADAFIQDVVADAKATALVL